MKPTRLVPSGLTTLTILLALMIIATNATAQSGSIDPSFSPVLEISTTTGSVSNFVRQPDGKIVVIGNFQIVNGVPSPGIARLLADGTGDSTFNCTTCHFNIGSMVLQEDGKIVISPGLSRLNSDGSKDTTFASPFTGPSSALIENIDVRAIQPDGKILAIVKSRSGTFVTYRLYRLLPSGELDPAFTPVVVGSEGITFRNTPGKLAVLPDGKILAVQNATCAPGCFGSATIQRFQSDGSEDTSFGAVSATATGPFGPTHARINDLEVRPDGNMVIVGFFDKVNAITRSNIAAIMPAGNVDLAYEPTFPEPLPTENSANNVELLSDGKVLVGTTNHRIYRLNADGSLDSTYVAPTTITTLYNWVADADGKVLLFATIGGVKTFAYLDSNGAIENSFAVRFGSVAITTAVATQPDGKFVIAGNFDHVNGVPRPRIARVNADGTLDTSFSPGSSGFNAIPLGLAIQPDGKILVIGNFSTYEGVSRVSIARLDPDGALDTTFNTDVAGFSVKSIALEPDGQILIGGTFAAVNNVTRTGFARLEIDGTLDTSFNPIFGAPDVRSIYVQTDGKIMVGGTFNGVNGFSRKNLVRLNFDGTLDTSFAWSNAHIDTFGIDQVGVRGDGKYVVLTGDNTILRLNVAGSTDAGFAATTVADSDAIQQFLLLPDSRIVIGGSITSVNGIPRSNIALLSQDGTVAIAFMPVGANGPVNALSGSQNDQIVAAGTFSAINDVRRLGIARINVALVAPRTPFDFDGDGRADVAVFRPSSGSWYELLSNDGAFKAFTWGQDGDRLAPADYDGDGRTDLAVFRGSVPGGGTLSYFYISNSSDASIVAEQFGSTGDAPMTGDWDGDGKADLAVYRDGSQTGGQSAFYYRPSGSPGVNFRTIVWGTAGDKPLAGDFDGDAKMDAAVFRPSLNRWYILKSVDGQVMQQAFGAATDIPVCADFDGDGKTDIAVYRPSQGTWYTSPDPQTNYGAIYFGTAGDLPVPADYDGDGKADAAVFRPSTGTWYILGSTAGFSGMQFGISEDKPIPGAYLP